MAGNSDDSCATEAWARRERIVEAFEQAWEGPAPPILEDYLAQASPADLVTVLQDLVLADMEMRAKRGEMVDVEAYLARFPMLRETPMCEAEMCAAVKRHSQASPGIENLPIGLQNHQRYRVIRRIGSGGMGDVYLAEHRLMGRTIALKTIRLNSANNPALVERFKREVTANAKLSHPNIVAVFDAEFSPDYLFLAMEYLEGDDLQSLVRAKGRLVVPAACTLLHQATAGVKHAHDRGVIHRDIKPANLFLVRLGDSVSPGLVKVIDFGLANVLQDAGIYQHGTPVGFAMGTRGYMSPEQEADTRSVGIQADIFSLGRTLYYLLSGQVPYRDGIRSLMMDETGQNPLVPLEQLCPGISQEIIALVEKMTARRPEDRFQSVRRGDGRFRPSVWCPTHTAQIAMNAKPPA